MKPAAHRFPETGRRIVRKSTKPWAFSSRRKYDEQNNKNGGRVTVKLSDTETITGTCHFFVRLKPRHFPNRAGLSRFLD
jgi:hypothetical protein